MYNSLNIFIYRLKLSIMDFCLILLLLCHLYIVIIVIHLYIHYTIPLTFLVEKNTDIL